MVQPHLKLPILTTHEVFCKQLLAQPDQRITAHSDRARVNRIHAVGPQPVTVVREPHFTPRRFKQSILRKATLAIRHAFKKVLTVRNDNLSFRKTRKHFELGIKFPWQPKIIRVEKPYKLAKREARTHIPRAARSTSVFQSQYAYKITKFMRKHLKSRIGRRIVNDDNFHFTLALRERTMNRVAHQLGTVPRRNHNAEQWSFHFAKRIW